jgi:hypothetical protein
MLVARLSYMSADEYVASVVGRYAVNDGRLILPSAFSTLSAFRGQECPRYICSGANGMAGSRARPKIVVPSGKADSSSSLRSLSE